MVVGCVLVLSSFGVTTMILWMKILSWLRLPLRLLVAPVTTPMYYSVDSRPLENIEKIRRVYLPAGAGWTDFWTGEKYKGGQWIVSEAAIDKIPLLVRQGSIIPMGPVMQYTSEKVDALY